MSDVPKFGLGSFGRRPEPDENSNGLPKHIQDQLDKVDRAMKEMDLMMHPEKTTEKHSLWNDDLFVHRTTTKWPPLDWQPVTPYTERTETLLSDFNNKWDHNDDIFKKTQVRDNVDTSIPHHRYTPTYVWIPLICLLPVVVVLLVMLAIFLVKRKNKWTPAAAVLPNGRVIGPGPVQRNQQIPMIPPGQGGAVPPNVPYSDNFNRPYNDEPPPYPTDADLQVQNNGIGFRNEIAAVPSAPPPYSDNGEPVESLNFGLNKEKAGQGTRNVDDKESVKYVDEKSVHK